MVQKLGTEARPSTQDVAKFKMLQPMLDSLLAELREFSKKKPDGTLSPLKVKTINRVLKDVKDVLGQDPSITYLDLLDDETLPQNSDAVLTLGQFKAAMTHFKEKHYGYDEDRHSWGWQVDKGFVGDKDARDD